MEGRSKGEGGGEGGGMQRAACALRRHALYVDVPGPVRAGTGLYRLRSTNVAIHTIQCRHTPKGVRLGASSAYIVRNVSRCLTVYVRRRPCSIGFGMPGLGSIPLFMNKGQLTLEREERKIQDRERKCL